MSEPTDYTALEERIASLQGELEAEKRRAEYRVRMEYERDQALEQLEAADCGKDASAEVPCEKCLRCQLAHRDAELEAAQRSLQGAVESLEQAEVERAEAAEVIRAERTRREEAERELASKDASVERYADKVAEQAAQAALKSQKVVGEMYRAEYRKRKEAERRLSEIQQHLEADGDFNTFRANVRAALDVDSEYVERGVKP